MDESRRVEVSHGVTETQRKEKLRDSESLWQLS